MIFTVLNMQTDATTGWAARAYQLGLKVRSHSGRFGDENYVVRDRQGNAVLLSQNTQRGRKLDASTFNAEQLAIVKDLQSCGLITASTAQ